MQKFPYYAITVRRYNVLFRYTDWIKKTQELYNEILLFYYRLYLETFPDQQPGTQEHPTEKFTESVIFYKGMYRDFQDNTISLKLWNGESWQWSRLLLRGNTVPEAGQMMSPALVLTKDRAERRQAEAGVW